MLVAAQVTSASTSLAVSWISRRCHLSSPEVTGDASRDLLPYLLQRHWRIPNPAPLSSLPTGTHCGHGQTSALPSRTQLLPLSPAGTGGHQAGLCVSLCRASTPRHPPSGAVPPRRGRCGLGAAPRWPQGAGNRIRAAPGCSRQEHHVWLIHLCILRPPPSAAGSYRVRISPLICRYIKGHVDLISGRGRFNPLGCSLSPRRGEDLPR